MKKTGFLFLTTIFLFFATTHTELKAEGVENTKSEINFSARFDDLVFRVFEIRGMDRSLMNRSEKQELKHELRLIKNELNDIRKTKAVNGNSTTVVISLSTVLLIIIILILLL